MKVVGIYGFRLQRERAEGEGRVREDAEVKVRENECVEEVHVCERDRERYDAQRPSRPHPYAIRRRQVTTGEFAHECG